MNYNRYLFMLWIFLIFLNVNVCFFDKKLLTNLTKKCQDAVNNLNIGGNINVFNGNEMMLSFNGMISNINILLSCNSELFAFNGSVDFDNISDVFFFQVGCGASDYYAIYTNSKKVFNGLFLYGNFVLKGSTIFNYTNLAFAAIRTDSIFLKIYGDYFLGKSFFIFQEISMNFLTTIVDKKNFTILCTCDVIIHAKVVDISMGTGFKSFIKNGKKNNKLVFTWNCNAAINGNVNSANNNVIKFLLYEQKLSIDIHEKSSCGMFGSLGELTSHNIKDLRVSSLEDQLNIPNWNDGIISKITSLGVMRGMIKGNQSIITLPLVMTRLNTPDDNGIKPKDFFIEKVHEFVQSIDVNLASERVYDTLKEVIEICVGTTIDAYRTLLTSGFADEDIRSIEMYKDILRGVGKIVLLEEKNSTIIRDILKRDSDESSIVFDDSALKKFEEFINDGQSIQESIKERFKLGEVTIENEDNICDKEFTEFQEEYFKKLQTFNRGNDKRCQMTIKCTKEFFSSIYNVLPSEKYKDKFIDFSRFVSNCPDMIDDMKDKISKVIKDRYKNAIDEYKISHAKLNGQIIDLGKQVRARDFELNTTRSNLSALDNTGGPANDENNKTRDECNKKIKELTDQKRILEDKIEERKKSMNDKYQGMFGQAALDSEDGNDGSLHKEVVKKVFDNNFASLSDAEKKIFSHFVRKYYAQNDSGICVDDAGLSIKFKLKEGLDKYSSLDDFYANVKVSIDFRSYNGGIDEKYKKYLDVYMEEDGIVNPLRENSMLLMDDYFFRAAAAAADSSINISLFARGNGDNERKKKVWGKICEITKDPSNPNMFVITLEVDFNLGDQQSGWVGDYPFSNSEGKVVVEKSLYGLNLDYSVCEYIRVLASGSLNNARDDMSITSIKGKMVDVIKSYFDIIRCVSGGSSDAASIFIKKKLYENSGDSPANNCEKIFAAIDGIEEELYSSQNVSIDRKYNIRSKVLNNEIGGNWSGIISSNDDDSPDKGGEEKSGDDSEKRAPLSVGAFFKSIVSGKSPYSMYKVLVPFLDECHDIYKGTIDKGKEAIEGAMSDGAFVENNIEVALDKVKDMTSDIFVRLLPENLNKTLKEGSCNVMANFLSESDRNKLNSLLVSVPGAVEQSVPDARYTKIKEEVYGNISCYYPEYGGYYGEDIFEKLINLGGVYKKMVEEMSYVSVYSNIFERLSEEFVVSLKKSPCSVEPLTRSLKESLSSLKTSLLSLQDEHCKKLSDCFSLFFLSLDANSEDDIATRINKARVTNIREFNRRLDVDFTNEFDREFAVLHKSIGDIKAVLCNDNGCRAKSIIDEVVLIRKLPGIDLSRVKYEKCNSLGGLDEFFAMWSFEKYDNEVFCKGLRKIYDINNMSGRSRDAITQLYNSYQRESNEEHDNSVLGRGGEGAEVPKAGVLEICARNMLSKEVRVDDFFAMSLVIDCFKKRFLAIGDNKAWDNYNFLSQMSNESVNSQEDLERVYVNINQLFLHIALNNKNKLNEIFSDDI